MPLPRKLDLIPAEVRQKLANELAARGFAQIVDVTEALNFWLEEAGLEIRIGKSAVGNFSAALKRQRDAFDLTKVILQDMEVGQESAVYEGLFHMIGAAAAQMMNAMADADSTLDAKSLSELAKMLKDLMGAAGLNRKLKEDAGKELLAEQEAALKSARGDGKISTATFEEARRILGLAV